jgi:hypothetical protein
MLQLGATGIGGGEEDINSVHTEKIDALSVVAKLILPLTTFLLLPHSHLAKRL